MDLCLKGSQVSSEPHGLPPFGLGTKSGQPQINLATRQKTKPKYTSRSLTTLHNPCPHFRPRSANFLQQRSRSSPFLGRPQSADPKFGRRLSNYFVEKELRNGGKVSGFNTLRSSVL